jgi:signal transduction histidine kinase
MRTLHQRLTVTHTLVALLAVLLVALLAGLLIAHAYRQLTVQRAQDVGRALAPAISRLYVDTGGDWDVIGERLDRNLGRFPAAESRRLFLADDAWRIQYDSQNTLAGRRVPPALRRNEVPLKVQGQTIGYLLIPIGAENRTAAENNFLRSIIFIVVLGSVCAGAVALVVAYLLARRLTAPLRSLTLAARGLAAGERHQPIRASAETELAELAHAFNRMAAELERQETLRRHMMADITHELRTPLSVLRLQIESLEDGIEQPTPEVFSSLNHEVGLLGRLVEDLRLISLADAGQLSLNPESLDPQRALEQVALTAVPRARQRGIDLRCAANGTLPAVHADPQRLAQVLGNLVENALRYTPQGGSVTLDVRKEAVQGAAWLVFRVSDTGPGIAPENLPHIFDRFYRTDRARARETGGSGLGLAIVERLVTAQGGKVEVSSTPGKGTIFVVWLPAATAPPLLPAALNEPEE